MKYWRWLLPPMLLASLGLHGLVLFVPVAPSEDDLVPPPDPEEDGIAITKIDAPQARSQAAVPANAGTVKTARPTATPVPTSTPQAAPTRATAAPTRPAASSARTASNANRGDRTPTTAARSSNRPSAQNRPSVPDLATVDPVSNPNAAAPDVASPTNPAANVAASRTDPFEEYVKVFEAYNGVQISEAEASEAQRSWLESFSDRGPAFTNLEIQPFKDFEPLPYGSNICLPSPPETAQVLVMVDADGEVAEYQQFIQRTGYRNFDSEATKLLDNYEFPETNTPQAYLAEIAVDYDPENCDWPPQVDKLPDEYFTVLESYVGPTLTTPAEAEAAQATWLASLKDLEDLVLADGDELVAEAFKTFEQEVEYPLEICLPIEPKDAQWGVIVNPDGSLRGEPEPLRSTGYRHFDDRAKELVENFDFPEAEATQFYVVEVPVAYNSVNCQGLDAEEFEVPATTAAQGQEGDRPATENTSAATSEAATAAELVAFNPEQQTRLIEQGRKNVEAASVGSLNSLPDIAAASIEAGWPEDIDRGCFLAELTPEQGPVPVAAAQDALVLSESFDFVPLTLSRLYGTEIADAGEFCGAPLLEMAVNGTPQLFSSTVGFGAGDANALVVIWPSDPREQQN